MAHLFASLHQVKRAKDREESLKRMAWQRETGNEEKMEMRRLNFEPKVRFCLLLPTFCPRSAHLLRTFCSLEPTVCSRLAHVLPTFCTFCPLTAHVLITFWVQRLTESELKKLKAEMKKCTSFVKKLRIFTDTSTDSLVKDVRTLRLTKYISEAVPAICEPVLKVADLHGAAMVCSVLHQRYKEFSDPKTGLLPSLLADFEESSEADAAKRRSTLRFLSELFLIGVLDTIEPIMTLLKKLVKEDEDATPKVFANLSLIREFAKVAGIDMLGITARDQTIELIPLSSAVEDGDREIITSGDRKNLMDLLKAYHARVSLRLSNQHKKMKRDEKKNYEQEMMRGELSETRLAEYKVVEDEVQRLMRDVKVLSDVLDLDMPEMEEEEEEEEEVGSSVSMVGRAEGQVFVDSPFEEEETRVFYERLQELTAMVPAIYFSEAGATAAEIEAQAAKEEQEGEEPQDMREAAEEQAAAAEEKPPEEAVEEDIVVEDLDEDADEKGEDGDQDDGSNEAAEAPKIAAEEEDDEESSDGGKCDALLARLPNCASRERMDEWAVEFCYMNTKRNRAKLLMALYKSNRNMLELLPHYARLTATLTKCLPEFAPRLVELLQEEFTYLNSKKMAKEKNIESKIRNVRFIAELVKFKVFPFSQVFNIIQACVKEFRRDALEQLSHIIDACGRFLYLLPRTNPHMVKILDILQRKKDKRGERMDSIAGGIIENAILTCNPPVVAARVVVERSPLEQYVRKMLLVDLSRSSVEKVLRQLRKMPWPESEHLIIETLVQAVHEKFHNIHCVASVSSGLATWYDSFSIRLGDTVLEEILWGLETNNFRLQQKRQAMVRFLGELYNYRQVDSSVVFETLYLLIDYGYPHPTHWNSLHASLDQVDPPHDHFRQRLVCMLLDTCGQYFNSGSARVKLDRFLTFFQRYTLTKELVPMDITFMLDDMFDTLRPKLVRSKTFPEANEDCKAVLDAEHAKAAAEEKQGGLNTMGEDEVDEFEDDFEEDEEDFDLDDDEDVLDAGDDEDDVDDDLVSDSDSDLDSEDEASEEEEQEVVLIVKEKPAGEATEVVDDEFEKQFAMMMDNGDQRAKPSIDISIPMALVSKSVTSENNRPGARSETLSGSTGRVFKLLTKQGGKQKVKDLVVPENTSLKTTKTGEDADEAAERDRLKRQVLAYDVARQEEERKMERMNRFGQRGQDPSQRLDVGSRFNATREVKEPKRGPKDRHPDEDKYKDIAEKAMKQKGTSKGSWKGGDAIGINFEL